MVLRRLSAPIISLERAVSRSSFLFAMIPMLVQNCASRGGCGSRQRLSFHRLQFLQQLAEFRCAHADRARSPFIEQEQVGSWQEHASEPRRCFILARDRLRLLFCSFSP
jgi:hypothetical protein